VEPKAQAAERLLRGLGVAIKTFALYPAPHPVTTKAAETLLALLRPYMEAHGPFAARITKYAITVDGTPFKSGTHGNLAFYLYTRKLAYFKIMPTVSEEALSTFLATLGMDRNGLEAAGGVKLLMRSSGVGNILVSELSLEHEEELEPFDLNTVFELLGRGRLSAQDRERVLEILRAGPEQTSQLLENAYTMAGGTADAVGQDEPVGQVYEMLRSLDRLMADEPFEDQRTLYSSLAGATILVREPMRTLLIRTMLHRDDGDVAARLLGEHLSSEQLAHVIQGTVGRGDIAEQVSAFLRAMGADSKKAQAVLSILDVRLHPPEEQSPTWLSHAVLPRLEPLPTVRREPRFPPEFVFKDLETSLDAQESEDRLKDIKAVDDAAAIREVISTLPDVLRQDQTEKEMVDVADALIGYLPWLVERQEFPLLAGIMENVREIADTEVGARRRIARDILKRMTEGHLLETLLNTLWEWRDTAVEKQVRACLQLLADDLVAPLVRILGSESRGVVRAMVCDLLASISADRVKELGAFVTDPRWYLVRNVADVLGRVRNPEAVAYLSQLVRHPDYRVRRETLNALISSATEDAQTLVAGFLEDPDERLRMRALESLDTWEAWKAMPKLVAIVERRDPWNRQFEMKRAALETLARLGARQCLPSINKIARARFAWGARGRELRRLAGAAAAIIEGQAPSEARTSPISDHRQGSRP
jgi:HEAT repeat protein